MADLFDYLAWRGDLDFSRTPLNSVDSLIFSQLSYMPFDGIVPSPDEKGGITIRDTASLFGERMNDNKELSILFEKDPELLGALAFSNRFGNCRLSGYVNIVDNDRGIQFSAICIDTDDKFSFVVYRGTDRNIVGWKEDFNMSFDEAVPAQLEAAAYLEEMAFKLKRHLYISGHSKGGNLAVYAAACCRKRIQKRIKNIYSFDSPGFQNNVLTSNGFSMIKDKILSFIPQASVVGMFFEHGCSQKVVKSVSSGLLQHELYSWEVTHNDLVYLDDITPGSRFVDKTVKEWIAGQNKEQREQFLNTLYSILDDSDVTTLQDFEVSWVKAAGRMIKTFGGIDENKKQLIQKTFGDLFNIARRNFDTLLNHHSPDKKQEE